MAGDDEPKSPSKAVAASANKQDDDEEEDDVVDRIVREVVEGHKSPPPSSTKKKRLCRYPGCTKVIKSQGHCQRHGAKAKRCKVEGCDKQAQGTHDGMCKRHWKVVHCPAPPPKPQHVPPNPEGASVYDTILPASVSYRPTTASSTAAVNKVAAKKSTQDEEEEEEEKADSSSSSDMPLVTFLRKGQSKPPGWHRSEERRARGSFPAASLSSQLEPWERQLALLQVFLLSGGVCRSNSSSFADLAHAWGREKGFHQLLVQSVCERRGEVERKKRSDYGKTMTPEERQSFRAKLKKARTNKNNSSGDNGEEEEEEINKQEAKEGDDDEALKPASVDDMEVADQASV